MESRKGISGLQFAFAVVSFLITVAVSYGALSSMVKNTKEEVGKIRAEVREIELTYVSRNELRELIQELKQHVDSKFEDNQKLIQEKLARIEDKIDKNNKNKVVKE